jgi:hypothetical protein
MSEQVSYEQFLQNVKRVRLTRAGLLRIMRENEEREAQKTAESEHA